MHAVPQLRTLAEAWTHSWQTEKLMIYQYVIFPASFANQTYRHDFASVTKTTQRTDF